MKCIYGLVAKNPLAGVDEAPNQCFNHKRRLKLASI